MTIWYSWAVYLAFGLTVIITLWIRRNSVRTGRVAGLWQTVAALGAILVLPSLVLAVDLYLSRTPLIDNLQLTPPLLFFLGMAGTAFALFGLLGYQTEKAPVSTLSTADQKTSVGTAPVDNSSASVSIAALPAEVNQPSNGVHPMVSPYARPELLQTLTLRRPTHKMAWLVANLEANAGKEFMLGEATNIGRDATWNEIAVDDPAMSRQHARIRFEDDCFVLYDLASTNGTLVNGERVLKQPLYHDDQIQVGETIFSFLSPNHADEETHDRVAAA
jgi:hypothetical protein